MKLTPRLRSLLTPLAVLLLLAVLILLEYLLFPQLIRSSLAKRSYDKGDYSSAEKTYKELHRDDPADSIAAHDLAKTYYKQGKPAEAEQLLKSWEAKRKNSADFLYDLGNMAYYAQDYGKAIDYYRKALLHAPEDRDAKANLELALKKQDEKKKQPPPQRQPDPRDKNKDKAQPKENEDYRNILNALDQKEALDRQNKQHEPQARKDKWW
ncbi:MAG TPA: tetratricopeptide repeat protein [Candidatus Cloacimonadota bacterium]|nr:tetratricopeptide repeat protein [Candidatus Cloacimonadota bacterium]